MLALDPDQPYDVLAINAASASTQLSGLPFSGPVGGTRVALIEGQWVAFPSHSQLEQATFDMVVAGRVTETGDVAIMMVEAEATEQTFELVQSGAKAPTEEVVASGLDAAKPFIKQLCEAQAELAKQAAKPVQEFPVFLDYEDDVYAAVEDAAKADLAPALTIAGKQEREERLDEIKASVLESLGAQVRGSREGDRRSVPLAEQVPRARARAARPGAHGRPRPHRHPHAVRRGRRAPAGARLGAVRARRDPDPGRHHAEHAHPGAEARHALAGEDAPLHAQVRLPAVLHR